MEKLDGEHCFNDIFLQVKFAERLTQNYWHAIHKLKLFTQTIIINTYYLFTEIEVL